LDKAYVRSLFDSIAYRYDLINHLLSGGVDLYWRRRAVERLRDLQPKRILDVATGTGDFAIAATQLKPERVIGVDLSQKMLELGNEKIRRKNLSSTIALQTGDAEHLEFDTDTFDATIVAFGVRNFEDLEAGLREMFRVLRPGGRIAILEFSKPSAFPFRQVYFFYFLKILPSIGRFVSKHEEAYQYLSDSVMEFPEGEEFLKILKKVGFASTEAIRLTFGIVTIYTAQKQRNRSI